MPPPGRDTYDTEWVYLSMFSESGCTLNMSLLFKDDQGPVRRRKQGNKELVDLDDEPPRIVNLNPLQE